MINETTSLSYLERLWDAGQRHLAAGRYVAARRELEAAEALAWRQKDIAALARIYLPLLEARRQIRYNAAEGAIEICAPGLSEAREQQVLKRFFANDGGTILLACGQASGTGAACRFAGSVQYASRRSGRPLEALLLLQHGEEARLATQADPMFAAGLRVKWTTNPADAIGPSTDADVIVPLPPPGHYAASDKLQVIARESLIVAWEALALKWQHRHPMPRDGQTWDEIAWLRLALRIDPACEPITMRLMALLENMERAG